MIEGVVPFPPEFAARYRAKGYWQDRSLRDEFADVFKKFAPRVFVVDGGREYTYADVDRLSERLALNLLDLGLRPLDPVVLTLPNVAEFVILYFALQKIGAIPIAALATHRYTEVSQFVRIAAATTCVYPESQGDFQFGPMIKRVQQESPGMKFAIVLGKAGPGEHSLSDLIERAPKSAAAELDKIKLDPTDPCIYQLSGGTTGVPKLIPRSHNDYAYNSKKASPVCCVSGDSVLLLVIPIAHNLALACPGIQGYAFNGGKVVVAASARPEEIFAIIQKQRVTHIKVVPALLIRLLNGEIQDALVFTRTKHRADRLARHLADAGINVERIHGNRSQNQRTQALDGFKRGKYRVLVATDIAARGIDVSELGHVVNFDVPEVAEDYVHRVGRTGRAEAVGTAFTLLAPEEEGNLRQIERVIGKRLPRVTVPGFDYAARPESLEVPHAQRIAEIRRRKREERERAQLKAARRGAQQRGGSSQPQPSGPRPQHPQHHGQRRSFGPRRRP